MNMPELDDPGVEASQQSTASGTNLDFAGLPHLMQMGIDKPCPTCWQPGRRPTGLYAPHLMQHVAGAEVGVDSDSEGVLEEEHGHRLCANLPACSCDGRWEDSFKLDLM